MMMMGHQLDRMQIICTSLQTDNDANTSSLNFLQAGCCSRKCPANSLKALKATKLFATSETFKNHPEWLSALTPCTDSLALYCHYRHHRHNLYSKITKAATERLEEE